MGSMLECSEIIVRKDETDLIDKLNPHLTQLRSKVNHDTRKGCSFFFILIGISHSEYEFS